MKLLRFAVLLPFLAGSSLPADDRALSGGETTVFQDGQNAFALPLANITRENRRAHVIGNSFFNRNWVFAPASTTARDGLGPLFHARSCSECHPRDGRSAPEDAGHPLPGLLFRFAPLSPDGSTAHPNFGRQFAPFAIPELADEGSVAIRYEEIKGAFADGSPYSLRKPVYEFVFDSAEGTQPTTHLPAPRIANAVFGLGLLEAIPEDALLEQEDPTDQDGDGISGRVHWIRDPETGEKTPGRFGWKASQIDLRRQTAAAFVDDLGITSSIHPREDLSAEQKQAFALLGLRAHEGPEVDGRTLDRVVRYLQTLAPPSRRHVDDPAVLWGESLFRTIGCAACHVPEWRTGKLDPSLPELAGQTIRPYTDLLLHDMGPGLNDGRRAGEAGEAEWRTPPLWGIGLTEAVNGHTFFLHDGRARNLEEAILWHGGEAEPARNAYLTLSRSDREALQFFLRSL